MQLHKNLGEANLAVNFCLNDPQQILPSVSPKNLWKYQIAFMCSLLLFVDLPVLQNQTPLKRTLELKVSGLIFSYECQSLFHDL